MTIEIVEGQLSFMFPDGWDACKYDEWSHYRNQFIKIADGTKAVDIVAVAPDGTVWLIEVKDYRVHGRTKPIDLADEVAIKVRDTLAGLVSARCLANDNLEKRIAARCLAGAKINVVLHLEQKLHPQGKIPRAIDPSNVAVNLKRRVKSVDPHPKVVESSRLGSVTWTVSAT